MKCSQSFSAIVADGKFRFRDPTVPTHLIQVKLLLPKIHRADSALRSQAAGEVHRDLSIAAKL